MVTYEEKKDKIDELLAIRKKSWSSHTASRMVSYMDYEDVCQIIRIHFYKKIEQYNPKQPFERWANKIITRQFSNISQKSYGKYAPPCISPKVCGGNIGPGLCSITASRTQCSECPFYANWEKKKQAGYNIQFAGSMEEEAFIHHQDSVDTPYGFNQEDTVTKFHAKMLSILPEKLKKLYKWIYIDKVRDEQLAELMGLKTNERGRRPGYRQISNIKNDLRRRGRLALEDFDLVENN